MCAPLSSLCRRLRVCVCGGPSCARCCPFITVRLVFVFHSHQCGAQSACPFLREHITLSLLPFSRRTLFGTRTLLPMLPLVGCSAAAEGRGSARTRKKSNDSSLERLHTGLLNARTHAPAARRSSIGSFLSRVHVRNSSLSLPPGRTGLDQHGRDSLCTRTLRRPTGLDVASCKNFKCETQNRTKKKKYVETCVIFSVLASRSPPCARSRPLPTNAIAMYARVLSSTQRPTCYSTFRNILFSELVRLLLVDVRRLSLGSVRSAPATPAPCSRSDRPTESGDK